MREHCCSASSRSGSVSPRACRRRWHTRVSVARRMILVWCSRISRCHSLMVVTAWRTSRCCATSLSSSGTWRRTRPCFGCSTRCRHRAGDRHLKFHDYRDNLSRRQPGPPRDRRVRRGSRPLVPTRLSRRAPRHRGTQDVAVAALAHPRPHRASLPPTHRASPRRLAHRRDTRPRLPTRRAHHLTASPPVAATTAPRPSDRARPNTSTRRVSGFPTRPTTRHDRSPHRNHGPNKPTIPPRAAHDFSSTIGANDLLTELRQSTASHR